MLLTIFTILIMLALGYAYLREGVFTAFTMCCNVLIAGLVAFNFWEPLADLLEGPFSSTFLRGYEDALCLFVLFCLTLGALRTVTNALANREMGIHPIIHRAGGVLFGLLTGYLASGFLLCALQTLPWHERFMFFDPTYEEGSGGLRRVLPADRVWLAMMLRAGAYPFANDVDPRASDTTSPYDRYYTFDKHATFEYRYARYRRYGDGREPVEYHHELDQELHGPTQ